jgi:hypothetical protein
MIARGRLSRMLLICTGFLVLVGGLVTLIEPRMLEPLGLRLDTPLAVNEIRARYGGVQTFVGVFLIVGAFAVRVRDAALMLLATLAFGLVIGRAVGIALDGWPGPLVGVFLAVEAVAAVAATGLLVARRSP